MRALRRGKEIRIRVKKKNIGIPRPRFGRGEAHTFARVHLLCSVLSSSLPSWPCTLLPTPAFLRLLGCFHSTPPFFRPRPLVGKTCKLTVCSASAAPHHKRQYFHHHSLHVWFALHDTFPGIDADTLVSFLVIATCVVRVTLLKMAPPLPSQYPQVVWRALHEVRICAHQLHMAATGTSGNHYRGFAEESR